MAYLLISENELAANKANLVIAADADIRYVTETVERPVEAKGYEIIDESGTLQQAGVIVLNNIPISKEGQAAFEERFLGRARAIEKTPGFVAIRVLRPLDDETYVVLTQWESEQAFRDWQQSSAYEKAHKKRNTSEGLDQRPGVLSNKPYHKVYGVQQ